MTSGQPSASAAISFSTSASLAVEERDLAHGAVDRFALADRQLLLGQPAPALDAEQIRRRRAVLQTAHQNGVDLVLGARAGPDQLRAAGEPPAHRADPLIGRPHPVKLARPQQLGQGPGVKAIGLGPRLADAGVGRRDHDHPRDMALEDPRDLPRIARDLQRDPIARIQALREQLKRLRPRLDATRRAHPALGHNRHLTEIAVNIQPYRSHPVLLTVVDRRENRWANDIDGSALTAQPGKSQGRPLKSPGSTRPSRKTACPTCVLPKAPVPVDRTYVGHRTSQAPSTRSFMPRDATAGGGRPLASALASVRQR